MAHNAIRLPYVPKEERENIMVARPTLRIVQTSPTTYAVQQLECRGWWLWRKQEWVNYAVRVYRGCDPCTGGREEHECPIHFDSIEAAEAWVQQQREARQYPRVVKELTN